MRAPLLISIPTYPKGRTGPKGTIVVDEFEDAEVQPGGQKNATSGVASLKFLQPFISVFLAISLQHHSNDIGD